MGIEEWQQDGGHPTFPPDTISCPLSQGALRACYSMEHVCPEQLVAGSAFAKQLEQLGSLLMKPPLNLRRPRGTPASFRQHMRPLNALSCQNYIRFISQFVGFCHLHLGKDPSLSLLAKPMLLAKYFGFHDAKGTSVWTARCAPAHPLQV